MKKSFVLIILIGIAIFLSSCSLNYKKYDASINGKQLYIFDEFNSDIQCVRISSWDVFFTFEEDIYIVKNSGINSCNSSLYIRDGFEYISLTNAVNEGFFEVEEILEYDWDFEIFKANFPLSDIDIERIEMTNEIGVNDLHIISDSIEIQSIKDNMYFYCSSFISGFEYTEEDIISEITIYDIDENSYTFLLKENGIIYSDEDMYSDNPNRFNVIYNEVFN